MDRRTFLRAAGTAAGGLALAACGLRAEGGEQGPRGRDELTFALWATRAELTAFSDLARDFEMAEGVAVRFQHVSFDQLLVHVDASLRSGQAPDLFRVTYPDLGTYAGQGALLDLSPHLPRGYGDEFRPGLWSAVAQDGQVFGIPHHLDTSMVLVNLDAAEAAGLGALPSTYDDAWSWSELDTALVALQAAAAPQRYATGVNWQQAGAYRWLNFVGQAGGRLLTESLEAPALDTAEGLEALRFTQSLFTRGLVPPTTSTKGDYVHELFAAGTLASVFAGDFVLPDLADVPFPFAATFLPVRERASAELGGNAVVATAGSPRAEQAARFLQFLAGEEQMAQFCERTTVLPTRVGLDAADLRYAVRPDLMELFVEQSRAIGEQVVEQTTIPRFRDVNAALVERLERAFVGREDPAAVLAALDEDVRQVLQA